ncbi:probable BOI-related E3 ubiquitin-protein ligase 2 [Cornus florida]|uniref:probable BOI-related E3 ubiquitin-protein ligase 2 n=1 Tax=Cornus florida TaxID=4283 RepID=UPI002897EAF0|nr:probable BOI-related E3 ubiquitin-protein ligase 2 [Cornus florida]
MAIEAQLCLDNLGLGSQVWMESACGFNELYLNLPQQQLQNLQQKSVVVPKNNFKSHQLMEFSQSIESVIENQRQEIDQFITLQNERLRLALQEQRKQQVEVLLKKYEAKAHFLLKQRDEEIGKAVQRTMELEELLRRMEDENQTWQRVAKENEAMAFSLHNTIEQLRESNACFTNGIEDAESCIEEDQTGESRGRNGKEEGNGSGRGREREEKMVCKSCNFRSRCVIFLPCRHLCSCKACEAFLDSCPVCGVTKRGSIEALM